MVSPARPVSPPDQHRPDPPRDAGPVPTGRLRVTVLVLALVTAAAALAFPFAPVDQPVATFTWTASDGAAAIPLMPYQPVELTVATSCATARAAGDQVLLSTVPLRPDPAAEPLSGLRLTASGGGLRVDSAGLELGTVALPPGGCTLAVVSDPEHTAVLVDGVAALTREGDVRPDVAGAFTAVPTGVDLALTADTRFQTTASPLKTALAAACLLALAGLLLALGRADRAGVGGAGGRAVRLLPRRWWRPRPVDAAVGALLGLWWLVGAITVDDGYIAGIVRSRGSNGFVGNVYRWLNAPEAPFSWFYELYHGWSLISGSTLWMRLPSTLLGLLCWGLLSRLVLPRLGRRAARPWLAALAFGAWWIPFDLGLRPEPWVAAGTLAVFLAVERAIATRRVRPLAVGLVLAGATVALTPGGLMGFAPFLAGALPLLRLLRARRDLHALPLLAALVAAPAAAVLLMVYDQSLAALLEGTRIRGLIGGGGEWFQEYERYAALLEPASFQGAIGRRAAVLTTLLAAAGVLWALHRRSPGTGIATGPARRLVLGLLIGLAVMTFSPTKWTQHFGDVAGYGTAVLVLGLVAWSAGPLRDRPRWHVVGLGAVTIVGALVLAGYNAWPYAAGWFLPSFSTRPPDVAGIRLATIALVAGSALVAGLLARSAWRRAGGAAVVPVPRRVPAPAPLVAGLLAAVLALQVLSFVKTAVQHRDSYTLASDGLATLRGDPCGVARLLTVETDPAAGLLPARPGPEPAVRAVRPVDVGGRTLPGVAVAGTATTGWFVLDGAQRPGGLPVVVTTSGAPRRSDRLALEFGDDAGRVLDRRDLLTGPAAATAGAGPRDAREPVPPDATAVRLVVDAPAAGSTAPSLVSLPRVPRLTPMSEVLPPGRAAILDWPVAFLFPCLTPEPLALGTAAVAQWRVGPPATDPAAGITYAPGFGGPFAAPRLLVTEQRMATYLAGDPTRDAAELYRWRPVEPFTRSEPTVTVRSVPGWEANGRARVPGLDPPG